MDRTRHKEPGQGNEPSLLIEIHHEAIDSGYLYVLGIKNRRCGYLEEHGRRRRHVVLAVRQSQNIEGHRHRQRKRLLGDIVRRRYAVIITMD